jgi:hypothetical protein
VNISQLGVDAPVRFKIRHAVTMEHDALVIDLSYSENNSTDVLGRAVVLAFRLSSIKAGFPNIITQSELLKLMDPTFMHFQRLKLSKEDAVKYFKDEKWGTRDIFASGDRVRKKQLSLRTVLRRSKNAIDKAEGRSDSPPKHIKFTAKIVEEMSTGPDWAKEVSMTYQKFVKDDILGTLKKIVPMLEKEKPAGSFSAGPDMKRQR